MNSCQPKPQRCISFQLQSHRTPRSFEEFQKQRSNLALQIQQNSQGQNAPPKKVDVVSTEKSVIQKNIKKSTSIMSKITSSRQAFSKENTFTDYRANHFQLNNGISNASTLPQTCISGLPLPFNSTQVSYGNGSSAGNTFINSYCGEKQISKSRMSIVNPSTTVNTSGIYTQAIQQKQLLRVGNDQQPQYQQITQNTTSSRLSDPLGNLRKKLKEEKDEYIKQVLQAEKLKRTEEDKYVENSKKQFLEKKQDKISECGIKVAGILQRKQLVTEQDLKENNNAQILRQENQAMFHNNDKDSNQISSQQIIINSQPSCQAINCQRGSLTGQNELYLTQKSTNQRQDVYPHSVNQSPVSKGNGCQVVNHESTNSSVTKNIILKQNYFNNGYNCLKSQSKVTVEEVQNSKSNYPPCNSLNGTRTTNYFSNNYSSYHRGSLGQDRGIQNQEPYEQYSESEKSKLIASLLAENSFNNLSSQVLQKQKEIEQDKTRVPLRQQGVQISNYIDQQRSDSKDKFFQSTLRNPSPSLSLGRKNSQGGIASSSCLKDKDSNNAIIMAQVGMISSNLNSRQREIQNRGIEKGKITLTTRESDVHQVVNHCSYNPFVNKVQSLNQNKENEFCQNENMKLDERRKSNGDNFKYQNYQNKRQSTFSNCLTEYQKNQSIERKQSTVSYISPISFVSNSSYNNSTLLELNNQLKNQNNINSSSSVDIYHTKQELNTPYLNNTYEPVSRISTISGEQQSLLSDFRAEIFTKQ